MDDHLVTVATFHLPIRAQLAKGMLESAGIEAFLADENFARLSISHTAFVPFRLQVRESDLIDAKEVLKTVEEAGIEWLGFFEDDSS